MKKLIIILSALLLSLGCYADSFGLIKIPVAPLREKPSHAAEMGTQALMGTPLQLHSVAADEFWKLTLPDGYKGYIHKSSIQVLSAEQEAEWLSSKRLFCYAPVSQLLALGSDQSMGYLPFGSIVQMADDSIPDYYKVTLPDGRQARAYKKDFLPLEEIQQRRINQLTIDAAINRAKQALGAPYLWGGTTLLAPDCSGLTQTAFLEAGIILPRNASWQAKIGEPVERLADALPGDLLFFASPSGHIDHVAIYLGNNLMIHSSAWVYIAALDKSAATETIPLYRRRPAKIRRLTPATPLPTFTR